jgi:tRNA A37 threonylcarbamoyladenosine modification protein TsaB
MNIFIDTLSAQAHLLLFQNDKTIVDVLSWGVKGKESSTLIPQIDILLKRNHINYKDLENIVVVNGP